MHFCTYGAILETSRTPHFYLFLRTLRMLKVSGRVIGSVYLRQHAKTQIKASMPQQNQSTDFSNHLPPTCTRFPFEWSSIPYCAPQNHPGKRSSLHCLPSRKRKAEKTSGLVEPETELHIREYMITKDKDDQIWPSKICLRYAQDMPVICPKYARDIPKIRPRYAQDIPKIYPLQLGGHY